MPDRRSDANTILKNIYFHLLSENETENASFLMPASLILCSSQKKMEVRQTVQPLNKICCCWLGALCELHSGRAWQSAASSCKQTWCMLLLIWTKDVTYKYVVSYMDAISCRVTLYSHWRKYSNKFQSCACWQSAAVQPQHVMAAQQHLFNILTCCRQLLHCSRCQ